MTVAELIHALLVLPQGAQVVIGHSETEAHMADGDVYEFNGAVLIR